MKHIKNYFKHISLADKCLLIIFTICLLQTIFMLFLSESYTQNTNNIDVIVRTTSAGIFGYLLSANFHVKLPEESEKTELQSKPLTINSDKKQTSTSMKADIGFLSNSVTSDIPKKGYTTRKAYTDPSSSKHVQTIIATAIGISALIVLLFVRNFIEIAPEMSSTISQLRDFISGCVGFLLGSQTNNTTRQK